VRSALSLQTSVCVASRSGSSHFTAQAYAHLHMHSLGRLCCCCCVLFHSALQIHCTSIVCVLCLVWSRYWRSWIATLCVSLLHFCMYSHLLYVCTFAPEFVLAQASLAIQQAPCAVSGLRLLHFHGSDGCVETSTGIWAANVGGELVRGLSCTVL
jgi:hypothetical protein